MCSVCGQTLVRDVRTAVYRSGASPCVGIDAARAQPHPPPCTVVQRAPLAPTMRRVHEPPDVADALEWRRLTIDRPRLSTLPAPALSGWGLKLSTNPVSPWDKRYFVFAGRFVCYFSSEEANARCLGAYYLPGMLVRRLAELPHRPSAPLMSRTSKRDHCMLLRAAVPRRPGGDYKDLVLSLQDDTQVRRWMAHASSAAGAGVDADAAGADTLCAFDPSSGCSEASTSPLSSTRASPSNHGRGPAENMSPEATRSSMPVMQMSLRQPLVDLLSTAHVLNEYRSFQPIGKGGQGRVYRAVRKADNEDVALKRVAISDPDRDLPSLENEINMLKMSDHANIVTFYGAHHHDDTLWIAMEYMGAGRLTDVLKAVTFTERHLAYICKGVLAGLRYLHAHGRIHRDIKSDNVLLNAAGEVKLCDFGFCAALTEREDAKRCTVIGTPYWMAPEVIQGEPYDSKADMWSVGIVALEMCDGEVPLMQHEPMQAVFMIVTRPPPEPRDPSCWSPACLSFIERMLQKDAVLRPTAAEHYEHAFLDNISTPDEFMEDAFM